MLTDETCRRWRLPRCPGEQEATREFLNAEIPFAPRTCPCRCPQHVGTPVPGRPFPGWSLRRCLRSAVPESLPGPAPPCLQRSPDGAVGEWDRDGHAAGVARGSASQGWAQGVAWGRRGPALPCGTAGVRPASAWRSHFRVPSERGLRTWGLRVSRPPSTPAPCRLMPG